MNAQNLAQAAYTNTPTTLLTDRSVEFQVFSKVTQRMKAADPETNYNAFVHALHDNRQLWNLLAVDVADANNQLPETLRAQLFYLAEFTFQHTTKILSGDATIEALIDINASIMSGLSTKEHVS